MTKPWEFVLVPRKVAVRDPVMQIGNNTSKSEASIQSRTALNAGEMENFGGGSIGSSTAKRTQRYARLSGYRNKFETKMSVSRKKRSARMYQHPLQDDGNKGDDGCACLGRYDELVGTCTDLV